MPLVEGTLDREKLQVNDIKTCVIGGVFMSSEQARFVAEKTQEVIHWVDPNEAELNGGEAPVLSLGGLGTGGLVTSPDCDFAIHIAR